jgi:hypothetical protein
VPFDNAILEELVSANHEPLGLPEVGPGEPVGLFADALP